MLTKTFNMNGGHPSQSCSSDLLKEETTPSPYGNFPVPFVRVSQTVKRFKPGSNDMVRRKPTAPPQTSSRFVDTFSDLELRLGINGNKSQVGELSETLQGSNSKIIPGMEGLPHPNQMFNGKRKRQNNRRPSATVNDINEHLSQLHRKKQLLDEIKPVESVLISRNPISNDSIMGPPNPSVVLETTKQCFLTFGSDATLSWTSSRVSSLSSSTGLAGEGHSLPSGPMPWEGLVANVQRQVVCAGGQPDGMVATVRTDRKRKLPSSALDSPLDHFLSLYRNSLQQSSDDDDDENELNAARFLGMRGSTSRQLAFSNNPGHMFASNAQPAFVQSTGICLDDDLPGQKSPFVSTGYSMFTKDHILERSERVADWSHESQYQTHGTNDNSFIREE